MKSALLIVSSLGFVAACSSNPPRDVAAGPDLDRYTEAQVVEEARELTTAHGIPNARRAELLAELDNLLADRTFRDDIAGRGVSGVCVYSGGSGGLLFTGGSANGLVSFAGGRREVPFHAESVAVGAFVGGQGTWCIGLLVGLAHENWFPGEYDGTTVSATALTASVAGARLASEWHDHTVRIVATGAGLAGGAGHVETSVAWK